MVGVSVWAATAEMERAFSLRPGFRFHPRIRSSSTSSSGARSSWDTAASSQSWISTGSSPTSYQYYGWKEQCLKVLRSKFDSQTCTFAADEEINEALKNCFVGQEAADFRQVQKQCMPFIKLKKVETSNFGPHALELKLPFSEIDVLEQNLELIKRQLGLEHVEVLSTSDEAALAKAGSYVTVLNKTPPSPGEPVAIFMTRQAFEAPQN